VKTFHWTKRAEIIIEIGQSSIKVNHGNATTEWPIERSDNGRLTNPCKQQLQRRLQDFLGPRKGSRPTPTLCAITARGVSLRQVKLPPTTKDNFDALLQLQVEREFPLPPDELAWGVYQPEEATAQPGQPQELTVIAVRKQTIDEYAALLSHCGLDPVFTLSSLSTTFVKPDEPCAILDIGRNQSELAVFENGSPASVRTLPWGGETLTTAIQTALGISHTEAETLKVNSSSQSNPKADEQIGNAITPAISALAHLLRPEWKGAKLYLTGKTAALKCFAPSLSRALDDRTLCESKPIETGEPQSAAIIALREHAQRDGHGPPLVIRAGIATTESTGKKVPQFRKWAALAGFMAILSLSLRYVEAVIQTPRLTHRIAEVQAAETNLSGIDIELAFLQYLNTNQPPYLQVLSAIAQASPRGTVLENVSLSRRGEVSIRGILPGATQATDFRGKLIASGWFSDVVLDEQTPKDKKVGVRMSAHWNLQGPSDPPPATTMDSKP